jgi:hypothetical protein
MNEYGYMVATNGNIPLHIVEIRHPLFVGFSVFNNAKDAKDYITTEKKTLDITYNPGFRFSNGLVREYTNRNRVFFSKLENKQIYVAR